MVPVDATTNAGSLEANSRLRQLRLSVAFFFCRAKRESSGTCEKDEKKKGGGRGSDVFLRHKTGKPKLDLAKICAELRLKLCQGLLAKLLQHDDVL